MFWGITLETGKKYTQTVKTAFHVSMAALEPQTGGDKHQNVGLMLEHDKAEFLLCNLNLSKNQQQQLDLEFTEGEDITFFLSGKGVVHLTGYLTKEDDDFMDEEESDEENVPQLVPSKSADMKRKAGQEKASPKKKMKAEESDEDDSDFFKDSSDDDDDDESDEDSDDVINVKGKKTDNQQKKQQVVPTKAAVTPSKDKQKGSKPGQQEAGKTPQSPAGVNGTGDQESGKKKKKKKNKKKNKEGESPAGTPVKTPSTTPKQKTPASTTLPTGVIVQDTQLGSGPEAKSGRFVHVYYVGRLHKDNKQFDSAVSGKPFKFRLGKGEVIKGWEDGLQGMKVGGKRKLTIPAAQAYGSKQMGPIPANSTLIFDVELKAVS